MESSNLLIVLDRSPSKSRLRALDLIAREQDQIAKIQRSYSNANYPKQQFQNAQTQSAPVSRTSGDNFYSKLKGLKEGISKSLIISKYKTSDGIEISGVEKLLAKLLYKDSIIGGKFESRRVCNFLACFISHRYGGHSSGLIQNYQNFQTILEAMRPICDKFEQRNDEKIELSEIYNYYAGEAKSFPDFPQLPMLVDHRNLLQVSDCDTPNGFISGLSIVELLILHLKYLEISGFIVFAKWQGTCRMSFSNYFNMLMG
ncbi:MAG: hypothetical protein MHMPM18_004081 [Marteilia pararefringens]